MTISSMSFFLLTGLENSKVKIKPCFSHLLLVVSTHEATVVLLCLILIETISLWRNL